MKYFMPDQDETIEDAVELLDRCRNIDSDIPSAFAENAAWYYYSECEGYLSEWPIVFAVVLNDDSVQKFSVSMSMDPTFSATRVKE